MNLPFLFTCMLIVALSLVAVPGQGVVFSQDFRAPASAEMAMPTAAQPDVLSSEQEQLEDARDEAVASPAKEDEDASVAKSQVEQRRRAEAKRFESFVLFLQILRAAK